MDDKESDNAGYILVTSSGKTDYRIMRGYSRSTGTIETVLWKRKRGGNSDDVW